MRYKTRLLASGMLVAALGLGCMPSMGHVEAASNTIRVGTDAATISDAIDMAESGDTIIIPTGTYKEQIYIEKDDINLIGEVGAVLDGSKITPKSGQDTMVYIQASDVTVSNLEIKGLKLKKPSGSITPIGIEVDGGSSDVTISHCKIHDMGCKYKKKSTKYNAHGILVTAEVDNPIEKVTIDGCELYNLNLGNSEALAINGNVSGFEIKNNFVHDCDNIGIDIIGFEQSDNDELDRARDGEILYNTVDSISSDPTVNVTYDCKCAGGIYVDGARDIKIHDNNVSNCDIGIEVASEHADTVTTGIEVYDNNLMNNNAFAGISFGGYDVDETGCADNCSFHDNTIQNGAGSCFMVQYACDETNQIVNNTFITTGSAKAYTEAFGDKSSGNIVSGNTKISK